MDKNIAHLDLDSFFVSVERLINSSLNGKPVLVGGKSNRSVVASCSYEARRFGVHSAMPMRMALRLCPEATVVQGDYELYSKYSDTVTEIIGERVPLYEKASIDEHYIDLTGMDQFFGCWKWATELRKRIISETGLPISLGLSNSKTTSKIATGQAKPCGELKVDSGTEKEFLAPLSIRKIPMVGEKAYTQLRNMGISKCLTLQQMDIFAMRRVMGENGISIWKKANAIDESPVVPFFDQKSISKEITFQKDTIDPDVLKRTLSKMISQLGFELRQEQKLTGCITVKIRYSNFDTHSRQLTLPYTNSDSVIGQKIFEMFEQLYSRRMLIRLIGVRFSRLIRGSYQISLFDDDEKDLNLNLAMDHIRNRYGFKSVSRGGLFVK
ncbi:MAG: DNA polymerase IV [Flavobacteriia bacterium]|nr:DNA polymerase IV [Flavobacteriia bacterium]